MGLSNIPKHLKKMMFLQAQLMAVLMGKKRHKQRENANNNVAIPNIWMHQVLVSDSIFL